MANKMVSSIKNLTTGVGDLVKKVDQLYASLSKVNTVASKAIKSASSSVSTVGGQYGLTQGTTRPGTGADGAHFTVGEPTGTGNLISRGLANFSYMQSYGYGQSRFGSYPMPGLPGMSASAVGKANLAMSAVQFGAGVVSGALDMIPGVEQTMGRALGYYQAGLRSPGINRNQLERATFNAMGGGISAVGSDAQVAAILSGMGYAPGSANYKGAAAQVGGAYKYLGISNESAAQAIGGMQTGPMQSNLFQYGITTYDVGTGKEKTTGQIARELMGLMTGGRQVSVEQVQQSYKMGALGANLKTMGFDPTQETMLYQAMIDLASGRNPDLQTASPVKGNENTFLTAQGRLNASTTDVMMAAEEKMIKGFENAADTVEFFNRQVKRAAETLGYIKGYTEGVSGTPAGKGGGRILKNIAGGALVLGGLAVSGMSFGGAAPLGLGMAAVGGSMLGGGTTGYGSSFGVANRKKTGGGDPGGGAAVTAGYGATYTGTDSPWSGTNGKHTGVDYDMPIGTPVTSAFNGVVSAVNLNKDYGTSVMIDNADGTQAIYAHLSEKSVNVGDQIAQGQVIGKSGQSGNATSPHLHFELRNGKNNPVDPSKYTSSGSGQFGEYARINPTGISLTAGSGGSDGSASSSVATSATSTGSGKGLSDAALSDILSAAGFKGTALVNAIRVARAESGGIPNRHSHPSLLKDDSYGLFQINMLEGLGERRNKNYLRDYGKYGYTGPESLYDPLINARIAYDISKGGTNWSTAWVNTSAKLGIGGATTGYGASLPTNPIASGNRTVNVTLKIERASEEEAMSFAKRVKHYLEQDNEISTIGKS